MTSRHHPILCGLLLWCFFTEHSAAIDCFECNSVEGSWRDCEDMFGPDNMTEHLLHRNCRVGYLLFQAHYCVKIKGTKQNGEHILIRACSTENWGTMCGDLMFEQGDVTEHITGCLASCNFDGCNSARSNTWCGSSVAAILFVLLQFT